jgi:hypothetical protein
MKKYALSFLLIIIFASAIQDEYTLINSIAFSKASFTTDKLGNAYVIVDNQLLQFDSHGNPLANYSENNLGSLKSVDAVNPLKIVLFYPDFAKVIILDSKLAVQSTVDLRSMNINQPMVVCNSEDNGYWVYDREDDQLKKIDPNLQVVHQSGSVTQLTGYQVSPVTMTSANGYVYINNPETGILMFDRFGAFYKTLPYLHLDNFQVVDKDILFINKNKLFRYDSKMLDEKEVLLPRYDTLHGARIEQHELYLLTTDSLKFYSF